MIRVLHIMGCADAGGISSVVLNYYRFIDRTKIHFDIALTVTNVGQNTWALQELGAEVFFLPLKSQCGIKAFQEALEKLLLEGNYQALHVHESETCYVALQVAKKLGIPCRIAHAHTASPYEGFKGELRRISGVLLNDPVATHLLSCSQLAGDRVFGKWNMKRSKALVLPNAVDAQRFAYNPQVREEVRRELGVEGKFVMGMVGRLAEEKNFPFALRLMARLREKHPDVVLVIAGNGEEEQRLKSLIVELGIGDRVHMLGRRADVERLYQAYDVFLLPSFHEGLGMAAVEAMAAGLPVLLSDTIPRELAFGSAVRYLPLSEPESWMQEVLRWHSDSQRAERQHEPGENGLDIRQTAGLLEKLYLEDVSSGK